MKQKKSKLQELFQKWEYEERAARYTTFSTAMTSMIKELYADKLDAIIYDENPLLSRIPKDKK